MFQSNFDSLSDAELLEINTWDDFRDPGDDLIDLNSAVLNSGYVHIRKKVTIEEFIEELMGIYHDSIKKNMRFGEWGGLAMPPSEAMNMKWEQWD